MSWGRKARDIMEEFGQEAFRVKVSDKSAAAMNWEIASYGGGMGTAGIGGPVAGRGADLMVIDDPVKNADEAESQVVRDKQFDWFQSTAYTRLESSVADDGRLLEGACVIVMTRWHEDDLAGRLLREMHSGGEYWHTLTLPAIAEKDEFFPAAGGWHRKVGDALWPERFDKARLKQIENAVGPYWWNALYQQRPSSEEGNLLKRTWWKYYIHMPREFEEVVQSWDTAFKDANTNDYVVGQVWGRIGAEKYLLDQFRARTDLPGTMEAIRMMTHRWPVAELKLIEESANGPAVIQMLHREIEGLVAVPVKGTKESRVHSVAPQIEAGNIWLPDPHDHAWVRDFVEECARFPTDAHDDQVDAMSQALMRLSHLERAAIMRLLPNFGHREGPIRPSRNKNIAARQSY
jgi:predicted phage terminase large subunit-like protein